jgi:3',5'-cyclic-AMP phosphodiesterase
VIVFAQLSDTHLDGGPQRARRARAVMQYLRTGRGPLDAVLVTGDIADSGRPREYQQAREILTAACPVLCTLGNHDARGPFRRVMLGDQGDRGVGDRPINLMYRVAGAVFALCDSTIPGRGEGYLADETIAWLDSALGEDPAAPAFVVCHHQPVPLHTPDSDEIRLSGPDRLAAVIERHPQVVATLCGHAHSAATTRFAGRPLLAAPGVAATGTLPWEPAAGPDHGTPPGVAYHVLGDDGRLTTHYRAVWLAS